MANLKFKYAFIDGNWVLHRNFCAMGGVSGTKLYEGADRTLITSVVSSFLKMTSEFDVEKIIILWDTPPYAKVKLLDDYKGGRYHPSEEEAEQIEDPAEKERELNNAYNFRLRSIAKEDIKSLGSIGLPSIWKQGFEADDLAYLFSKYCSDKGDSCVLISVDSDWEYWTNPGSCIYNPKRDELHTHEEICKNSVLLDGMSLFRFKSLIDTFYGSHNDLEKTIRDDRYEEDCHDVFREFEKTGFTTELFDDPHLAELQLRSFDFSKYDGYKDIQGLCESLDSIGGLSSLSGIIDVAQDLNTNINTNAFKHYYSTLNSELFKE